MKHASKFWKWSFLNVHISRNISFSIFKEKIYSQYTTGSKSNSNGNVTFKVVLVEDLLDYGSTWSLIFDKKNKAIDFSKKSGIEQYEIDTVFTDARVFLDRKRERGSVSTSSSKSN